ncbi:RNA polymerase sigma factor [Alkaliflexus imshenetskii]|uniref:RNA polymerase sigma factor n=1 Tax=Alkaliflexus imshenetskii TaxID=286730 RepID=UPI00047A8C14|nr:RNA polymerase sigma factor [Alkaliflexus imshenetskii]
MHPTDQEILTMAQIPRQREEAFSMLVEKYRQRLYWHLRKMVIIHEDADDLLQNTFIKVWKNLGNFRGDSALFTWLYRIATNEALNHLNKKRTELLNSFDDLESVMSGQLDEDPLFNGDEIQKRLQKSILTLPDKQRLVFNMKYFDEMKYEEMAEILNTSVGALKASYFHAVRKIEALIDKELF